MPAAPPHPPLHRQPRLLVRMFSEPQPVLEELRADYGPVVGLGFGPARMAIIGGPAEVRSLFTRPVEDFRWNHKFNALAVVVGKQSMITSDGDDWARRRGAVQSAFSRRRLNGWIPMIIEQADAAVDALPADGSHQVDLYRVGRAAILEIVVRAFFGASMAQNAKKIGDLMQRPQDYLELPAWKQVPHPFPLGTRGRVRADRRAFDDMVREAMADIRGNPSHDPDDVLEVLVHDQSLSEQEILDQVNTLVGAGFDTTAASLAWMLWCCGLAPDVWEALRAEAGVVLGAPGEQRVFDHTTLNRRTRPIGRDGIGTARRPSPKHRACLSSHGDRTPKCFRLRTGLRTRPPTPRDPRRHGHLLQCRSHVATSPPATRMQQPVPHTLRNTHHNTTREVAPDRATTAGCRWELSAAGFRGWPQIGGAHVLIAGGLRRDRARFFDLSAPWTQTLRG